MVRIIHWTDAARWRLAFVLGMHTALFTGAVVFIVSSL